MDLFSYTYPGLDPSTTGSGSNFLGNDGLLSKAGETALDLLGLYGQSEIDRRRLRTVQNEKDPEISASQNRAGIVPQFVIDNRMPFYIIGGVAAVGILAAVYIASRK